MTKPYGLLADLHLHRWSAFATTLPGGMNSRLDGLLREVRRAAEEVKAAGGDTMIFAGDIFHVRGSVAPTVLNPTRDCLDDIVHELRMKIHIMPGNHDLEGRDSVRLGSAVTALEIPGDPHLGAFVSVTDKMFVTDDNVLLVPWIENIEDLKRALQETDASLRSKRDLIIHAPIDGVIDGLPCHGLEPDFLAGLGFKRVLAGHYHNHKAFPGEVYSIGALAHHTWSDVGSKAGFCLVYPDRVEWRKSHLPAFIDLNKLSCDPEDLPLIVDRNYVRVRVEADKTKEVEAARKELLDMGALAVLVEAQPKAPIREGTTRASAAAGASLEQSVSDFVKTMKELGDDENRKHRAVLEANAVLAEAGEHE